MERERHLKGPHLRQIKKAKSPRETKKHVNKGPVMGDRGLM